MSVIIGYPRTGNWITTISLQPVSCALLLGGAFIVILGKLPGVEKLLRGKQNLMSLLSLPSHSSH